MLTLSFNPRVLPRTTSRRQWREIDRWRRLTQRDLREAAVHEEETLRHMCEDIGMYGTARLIDVAERMINPPLVSHPSMGSPLPTSLRWRDYDKRAEA